MEKQGPTKKSISTDKLIFTGDAVVPERIVKISLWLILYSYQAVSACNVYVRSWKFKV